MTPQCLAQYLAKCKAEGTEPTPIGAVQYRTKSEMEKLLAQAVEIKKREARI